MPLREFQSNSAALDFSLTDCSTFPHPLAFDTHVSLLRNNLQGVRHMFIFLRYVVSLLVSSLICFSLIPHVFLMSLSSLIALSRLLCDSTHAQKNINQRTMKKFFARASHTELHTHHTRVDERCNVNDIALGKTRLRASSL